MSFLGYWPPQDFADTGLASTNSTNTNVMGKAHASTESRKCEKQRPVDENQMWKQKK